MSETVLHIKNMVCPRCIKVVKEEFEKLDIPVNKVDLGIVETATELNPQQIESIRKVLKENGFELIDDKNPLYQNVFFQLIELQFLQI